jgi:hypothetical protein
MFKIRATVIDFLGDEEKYPCHFLYKIGDEIIWDGEQFIGRICPIIIPQLTTRMYEMHSAGPRWTEPGYHYPYWTAPVSIKDSSKKIYDGRGFKNILETRAEPKYHMANLKNPRAWVWPPHTALDINRDPTFYCRDTRTAAQFKLEAIDLSEKGFDAPFFRREMSILKKVSTKPGITTDRIINEFTKEENEGIYPALNQLMMSVFFEELELMDYFQIKDGKATVTEKGKKKLDDFKKSITAEEREALGMN